MTGYFFLDTFPCLSCVDFMAADDEFAIAVLPIMTLIMPLCGSYKKPPLVKLAVVSPLLSLDYYITDRDLFLLIPQLISLLAMEE